MTTTSTLLPRWTLWVPIAGWVVLGAAALLPGNAVLLTLVGASLAGAVFAGVHHAEVVAHRVGEPFGTLVLAVADGDRGGADRLRDAERGPREGRPRARYGVCRGDDRL